MTDHEDRLRERVREWKERKHPERGGLSRAAAEIGVSHAMLSEYLAGRRSAKGEQMAKGIAKVLNISTDEVLDAPAPRRAIVPDATAPVWANIPGWPEARAEARAYEPDLPERLFEKADRASAYDTPYATRDLVLKVVALIRELERDNGEAARLHAVGIDAKAANREARHIEGQRRIREMEGRGEKAPSLPMMMKQLREEGWEPPSNDAAPVSTNDAPAPKKGRAKK